MPMNVTNRFHNSGWTEIFFLNIGKNPNPQYTATDSGTGGKVQGGRMVLSVYWYSQQHKCSPVLYRLAYF